MSLAISGKTAIVTGAASGVGLAIARHFLDRGVQVICADADENRLVQEFGEAAKSEGPARIFAGNLCEKLALANLLSASAAAFDRIDILVNAALTFVPDDPLDPACGGLETMLQTNLVAGLKLAQMTARRMIAQAGRDGRTEGETGAIINISSLAARRAQPGALAYAIACAAQEQATRSLAVALAPHRIRVNGVAFASVLSGSLQATLRDHPDWRGPTVAGTPMGHIAPASELVEAVQFLASPGAGFITGQILTVDGGRGLIDAVPVPAY